MKVLRKVFVTLIVGLFGIMLLVSCQDEFEAGNINVTASDRLGNGNNP